MQDTKEQGERLTQMLRDASVQAAKQAQRELVTARQLLRSAQLHLDSARARAEAALLRAERAMAAELSREVRPKDKDGSTPAETSVG